MILALDTATPECRLSIWFDNAWHEHSFEAGRTLGKELIGFAQRSLESHGQTLQDVSGIVAFQGPGSFTGLRIGLTVLNTLADAQHIPIVGVTGEQWQEAGRRRLEAGDNDQLVMPFYGSEAHITQPRK